MWHYAKGDTMSEVEFKNIMCYTIYYIAHVNIILQSLIHCTQYTIYCIYISQIKPVIHSYSNMDLVIYVLDAVHYTCYLCS